MPQKQARRRRAMSGSMRSCRRDKPVGILYSRDSRKFTWKYIFFPVNKLWVWNKNCLLDINTDPFDILPTP